MSSGKYKTKVSSTKNPRATSVANTVRAENFLAPMDLDAAWSWNNDGLLMDAAGAEVLDASDQPIKTSDQLIHPEVQSLADCDTKYVPVLVKALMQDKARVLFQAAEMLRLRAEASHSAADTKACLGGMAALNAETEVRDDDYTLETALTDNAAVRSYHDRHSTLTPAAPAKTVDEQAVLLREASNLADGWFKGLKVSKSLPSNDGAIRSFAEKHLTATQGAKYAKQHSEAFAKQLTREITQRDARLKEFNARNNNLRAENVAAGLEAEDAAIFEELLAAEEELAD